MLPVKLILANVKVGEFNSWVLEFSKGVLATQCPKLSDLTDRTLRGSTKRLSNLYKIRRISLDRFLEKTRVDPYDDQE